MLSGCISEGFWRTYINIEALINGHRECEGQIKKCYHQFQNFWDDLFDVLLPIVFVFYKPEKSTKENDKSAAIEALLSFLYVKFTEVLMQMCEK